MHKIHTFTQINYLSSTYTHIVSHTHTYTHKILSHTYTHTHNIISLTYTHTTTTHARRGVLTQTRSRR
uniref:Uncharacterized protein n=1 Tax=Anguilla anguilla TaxID=7936 RepID=A0A0E9UQB1_ANGAN